MPADRPVCGLRFRWPGAHTQAETLDEMERNLREVIEMLLEDGEPELEAEFIGTHNVVVK